MLPLGQLLGPYVVMLLVPLDKPELRRHAREALNFPLNVVGVIAVMLGLLLWIEAGWWYLLLFVPNLYGYGAALRAATCASHGRPFRYRPCLRILR